MFHETVKATAWTLVAALSVSAFVASPEGRGVLEALERFASRESASSPARRPWVGAVEREDEPKVQTSYFGAETQLELGAGGNFHGRATIDGEDVSVIVDTGASLVVLPFAVAERLGVLPAPAAFAIPVSTANGQSHIAPIVLRHVRIGAVEVAEVQAAVAMEGAMGDEALLGMTFLGRLRDVQVIGGRLVLRN